MVAYLETDTGFDLWAGQEIDGVMHPRNIDTLWSDADLNAIGLFRPAEADPVPEGKRVVSTSVQRVNGAVKYVHELEDLPANLQTNAHIIAAPALGFGGPTGKELFNGNR